MKTRLDSSSLCGECISGGNGKIILSDLHGSASLLLNLARRIVKPNGGRDYTDAKEALGKLVEELGGRNEITSSPRKRTAIKE